MSIHHLKYLALLVMCLLLWACNPPIPADTTPGGDGGPGSAGDGTTDGGTTDDGAATDDDQTDDGSPDTSDGGDNETPSGDATLRGRISPGQVAKVRPRAQSEAYPFTVVAQSDQTGQILRAETGPDGDFEIGIPEDEVGNSFMVTILGPDGRAVGPVLFGQADDAGITGLAMQHDADLGTVELPYDPTAQPIQPGSDGDADDLADPAIVARLNEGGAPIGLASHGKGEESVADQPKAEGTTDADQDGLIDIFDADDDGNGIVDDFDTGGDAGAVPPDVRANFFMNLKIQAELAPTYYAGTADEIAARLAQDTVITFEAMTEPNATRAIASARLLETPGPTYLTGATTTGSGPGGPTLWADSNYAFNQQSDRFDVFVCPNAVMDAGDSFTVEITFDDSTVEQYCRMINYVFKNIPKLVQYGPPDNLTAFDVTDPGINGTWNGPIPVDGAQDLVLVFEPPPDETGTPIIGMDYSFQMFYYGNDVAQNNSDIDVQATWPTPVPGLDRATYRVQADELGDLSADGTYSVTLPIEVFPDNLILNSGQQVAVEAYKIDITAEAPTGNAAIMLAFQKQ